MTLPRFHIIQFWPSLICKIFTNDPPLRSLGPPPPIKKRTAFFSLYRQNGLDRKHATTTLNYLSVHNHLACQNSRPSSLPAKWRFARRTSAIYCRKFHTGNISVNFEILHKSAKSYCLKKEAEE